VAARQELGLDWSAFDRPFLYMTAEEAEIIFQRFCNAFTPELA